MASIAIRYTRYWQTKLSNGVVYDCDAWNRYPRHRWLFNKLDLSLKLGYAAGPGGTSVPSDGDYIVRPIMNLSGMGVGATRQQLKRNDYKTVPPGYFWSEFFHGPNVSVDYEWVVEGSKNMLKPVFAAEGYRTSSDLYRFNGWKRIDPPYWDLPEWIKELHDVPRFNIEFVYDKIIEIHLRPGNDFPDGATQIIPIWSDMSGHDIDRFIRAGYTQVTNFDDADGHLKEVKRLGFLWK